MYPDNARKSAYQPSTALTQQLCGLSRPTFFDGVCNVVWRLFDLVQPTHAFFGDKDLQQRVIIQHMVRDLNLSIQIVPCPIVRDANGLALSSRNQYLDAADYKQALSISKTLNEVVELVALNAQFNDDSDHWTTFQVRQYVAARIEAAGLKGEYVEVFRPSTACVVSGAIQSGDYCCVAAICNGTRLIDNCVFIF